MKTIMWLLTASFIVGTGIAAAQQEPPGPAPAEKIAPNDGLNPPAPSGATPNSALEDAAAVADRKNNKELSEGKRTGELQENRGRTETTGQAPAREQNRAPDDPRERVVPAAPK
jgi:hypothetical protein